MPSRILRESALDSDRIAAIDEKSEVLFYRLLLLADDFGRYDGRLPVIRARAFALRQQVTETEIERRLAELDRVGLIIRYACIEKPYISIPRFGQRQRADKSKFPEPPDISQTNASQVPDISLTSAPVVVVVDVDVCEGVVDSRTPAASPALPKKGKKVKTALPADFEVSDRVQAWAEEKGFTSLGIRLEHFIGKVKANGYSYVDWDEAFMGAVRDDWAKLNGFQKGSAVAPEDGKITCAHCKRRSGSWTSSSYGRLCDICYNSRDEWTRAA